MNVVWLERLKPDDLVLSSFCSKLLGTNQVTVHFGSLKVNVKVITDDKLPDDIIELSTKFSDTYTIPKEITYEVIIKDRQIYIGPIIAYTIAGSFKDRNNDNLLDFLPRFQDYENIKGLIFICTKDSIHLDKGLVEGFYYDNKGFNSGSSWKYGRFPLPNAIFNRSYMSQNKIGALKTKIGDTIFNSYWRNLNKWLIWKNLSQSDILKKHLPHTEKFIGVEQLKELLNRYSCVYIKPLAKSRGKGIICVEKTNEGFLVIDAKKHSYRFKDDKSIARFLKDRTANKIIQQGVPFKLGNRQVDFRVYLQKDENSEWAFQGFTSRISQQGSILTNTCGREKLMRGREALINLFKINEEVAVKIENDMAALVESAVQIYEESGIHIGDVAADLILDSTFHLWLLELQLNYAAERKADEIPPEIFKKIMTTPFRYAKKLAGFSWLPSLHQ